VTESLTICVVDDDISVRRALTRLLESGGYRVQTFASGAELLRADLPGSGCVILDVQMPVLSGVEVYRRLRKTHPEVPVLFLTAHADDLAGVIGADGVEILRKPLDEPQLLAALERLRAKTRRP
jgi:FixJ family two-component response regulator